jgi:NAD/NADP transhydrogenase alpha subunit
MSTSLLSQVKDIQKNLDYLVDQFKELNSYVQDESVGVMDERVVLFIVFILSCFLGYFVVWRVKGSLHSPLMSMTNAISSVIIVGALPFCATSVVGFLTTVLCAINIFGGFFMTKRMVDLFSKKSTSKGFFSHDK